MILELEKRVCSLKTAKILRQLRVEQDSLWSWCKSLGPPWNSRPIGQWAIQLDGPEENEPNSSECYSAYTVGELGTLLPAGFNHQAMGESYSLPLIKKLNDGTVDFWQVDYPPDGKHVCEFSTEVEARADVIRWIRTGDKS